MRTRLVAVCFLIALLAKLTQAQADPNDLAGLHAAFRDQSGISLVFDARELPPGRYHDVMIPLAADRQRAALAIGLRESRKLPQGFLQALRLKSIGVFEACASNDGDGFRPFDKELGGYRYFGIYNGKDGVAVAYYTDEQLPLTFHHEIFHHIDRLTSAVVAEDPRFAQIIAGKVVYAGPKISDADLAALKKFSQGHVLRETVSEYAAKNPAEDKAETARYFMSSMADSLVQVVEQPELPGSQRILHVLDRYQRALEGRGPTVDWFVNVVLGRSVDEVKERVPADAANPQQVIIDLRTFAAGQSQITEVIARERLNDAEKLAGTLHGRDSARLAMAAAAATQQLLIRQLSPSDNDRRFVVNGREDASGVNWTLRQNVTDFGQDATRLAKIAADVPVASQIVATMQLQNLRLFARYHGFIAANWRVTKETGKVFEQAHKQFVVAIGEHDPSLGAKLASLSLSELGHAITAQGALIAAENPYLKNIDAEIEDAELQAVIRNVQPACVRLGNGSGVNLSSTGHILTAAHVAGRLKQRLSAEFPDGHTYSSICTAIDPKLDLAICSITIDDNLPFARVAPAPPKEGSRVVCIGQPGTVTPEGKPTGYQPFNVSVGSIQGFLKDPLGPQQLGGTKHDAWTYWGHSGSPLFDDHGQVVAMHNSWDPQTAMRHAVTQQAIVKFLQDNDFGKLLEAR